MAELRQMPPGGGLLHFTRSLSKRRAIGKSAAK
jgi:hypothetical protein